MASATPRPTPFQNVSIGVYQSTFTAPRWRRRPVSCGALSTSRPQVGISTQYRPTRSCSTSGSTPCAFPLVMHLMFCFCVLFFCWCFFFFFLFCFLCLFCLLFF